MLARARLAAALLLAALALLQAWRDADRHAGVDAYQFWAVGNALHQPGPASVYSDADRARLGAGALARARETGPPWLIELASARSVLETYSTPLLYAIAAGASTDGYESYLARHRLLLVFGLAAGVTILARLLGYRWASALCAVAVFGAGFEPFRADMQVGNVGSLQLLAIALYLALVTRPRGAAWLVAGGAILGAAVAFKPNLAIVAALIAAHRILGRQQAQLALEFAGGAIGVLACLAGSSAVFGSGYCWLQWLEALQQIPAGIIDVARGNFAPARVMAEAGSAAGAAAAAPLAIGLSLAVLLLTGHRQRAPRGVDPLLAVTAMGCLLVLLATRLAWHHYYVLAIPALLLIARPVPSLGCRERALRLTLALACFAGISVRPYLDPGHTMAAGTAGVLVAVSVCVLFATVVGDLLLTSRRPAA